MSSIATRPHLQTGMTDPTSGSLWGLWNFSHDLLSRMPEHLVVTRADGLGWSDWGTPEAIERSFAAMGVVPPRSGRVEAA